MNLVLHESDETFERYNELLTLRAALINHHMYFEYREMPEVERKAEIARLESLMEEMSH